MKLNRIFSGIAAASVFLFSSCIGNGNDEQIDTELFNSAFSYTVNLSTGAIVNPVEALSMEISTNYTALDMDVKLMPMRLSDGISIPSAKIEDLKLQQNNTGWLIAEATNVKPVAEGFSMIPTLAKAQIKAINHAATLEGRTVIGYERAVRLEEGNFVTFAAPTQAWSTGETVVQDINTPGAEAFKSKKPIYLVSLDIDKKVANIKIYNTVFAPAMENLGLTIEFRDLPFQVDYNGRVIINKSEQFDPYHNNAPNPKFPISNLVCTWNIFEGIDISFNCGAIGSNYQVYASMPFNYGIKQSQSQN